MWLRIGGALLLVVGIGLGWIAWTEYGIAQREEDQLKVAVEKLKLYEGGQRGADSEQLEITVKHGPAVIRDIRAGVKMYAIGGVGLSVIGVGLLGWSLRRRSPA